VFEDLGDESIFLVEHRKKEMDFVQRVVFHIQGEVVCGLQGFAEFVGKEVVVHWGGLQKI
jgi:hypothetical protein